MNRPADAPSKQSQLSLMVACCMLLGVAEYTLYHVNFHQFFQGDAVFWMYFRFRSIGGFLRALVTLDVAHWYRPLSNRMIPSLLYPILGLRPYGYHLVVFASFFSVTCLVFGFLRKLTGKLGAAFFGAFYFSIHSINVYTTYDFAFTPEVFYVFFYVCTVWFLLEGEQRKSRAWRAASVVCCVLTLMSKEASVTFPAMLFVAHLFFVGGGFLRAFRAIAAHVVIWIAYLIYVVWYLGVGGGDYMLVASTNLIRNLVTAVFFAFNLHRVGLMPTRDAPHFVFIFLVGFAVVMLLLGLRLLLRREKRKLIAFGVLWFVIALAPMLMLNVLGPYYVFLALVGFSLVVGVSLNDVYERTSASSLWASRVGAAALLAMFWISCHSVLAADTVGDIALGLASRWAGNSANDMLLARPKLPPGTKIYILNDSMPDLWRFHGIGNLFKLLYQDDSITTAFRSMGQGPKTDGELVVMKADAEHLVDVTAAFKENPQKFISSVDESQFRYVAPPGTSLRVDRAEAIAGQDFYWLIVDKLGSDDLVVQYTLDEGPVSEARLHLNPEGKVRFFLTEMTPVGIFHFIRFRAFASPSNEWIKADASLRVLPPASRQH